LRDLFLVGGYSFNSARASLEESRRIELRMEFFQLDEPRPVLSDIRAGTSVVAGSRPMATLARLQRTLSNLNRVVLARLRPGDSVQMLNERASWKSG